MVLLTNRAPRTARGVGPLRTGAAGYGASIEGLAHRKERNSIEDNHMTDTYRITDYSTYGPDRPAGYVIETEHDRYGWCVPAWGDTYPELAGPFPTREDARDALLAYGYEQIA